MSARSTRTVERSLSIATAAAPRLVEGEAWFWRSAGTYTYNLNAGTLTTPAINCIAGSSTLNLNGGTLCCGQHSRVPGGLTAANVQ